METKNPARSSEELHACDFREVLEIKKEGHFAGTRQWVFNAVRSWLKTEQRLFWLVGGAGTGKSVVSAKLFDTEGIKEFIVGWHICRHNNAAESDLRTILQSLAAMLQEHLPGFEVQDVSEALSGKTEDMFEILIARPLERMVAPQKPALIVLDALDELPQTCLRPVLSLLTEMFNLLPSFVRVFVTSRDEAVIKAHLKQFAPLELKVDEIRNREDLRSYLVSVAKRCVEMDLRVADMEAQLEREFGLSPLSLKNKLTELEAPIRKSKDTYDVVVQKLKAQAEYRDIISIPEIKAQDTLQPDCDLPALYEDAKMARTRLLNLFASEWQVFKTIGCTVLRVPVAGKAVACVDRVIDPGLKDLTSAKRKIRDEYDGDARLTKDLARLTAECKNCSRMSQILTFLDNQSDIEVVGRRNKYTNPSPLGYRDLNLTVRITLQNGHAHLCEIQVNLEDMLVAKDMAHCYYETIREVLPKICRATGINKDQFESSVMRLLENSVLDSVVHEMEAKAGGLFLYAALVSKELDEEKGKIDISSLLKRLPNGLSDIYQSNFARLGGWKKYSRAIAMIAAAREPLLASFAHQVVGSGFEDIVNALSVLFPIREGRFEVVHKSVVDWLQDASRSGEEFVLSSSDLSTAHRELATTLLHHVQECLQVAHEWETETVCPETSFALRHVIYHLCQTGMNQEAQNLVLNFNYLLARAASRDSTGLLTDVDIVRECTSSPTVRLVGRALKLASPSLHQDWRYLPGQLVGRLIGSEKSDEVKILLESVRGWKGPADNRGWWCPTQQTLAPAGGSILGLFNQSDKVKSVAWSSDCKHVSSSDGQMIRVWDVGTGKCVQILSGHTDDVTSVAWSTNGRLCSGSDDNIVRVWDALSGECVKTLSGHTDKVTSVAWSKNGAVCSGSYDETVCVWDVASGECAQSLIGHTSYVTSVAWGADGRVCSGSADNTVRVWDVLSGKCAQTLIGHTNWVYSVAWSMGGGRVCSGSLDRTVRVWDALSGDCVRTLSGHTSYVTSVAWSMDGRVCSGSLDQTVRMWDVKSGECVQTSRGHTNGVTSVAWSMDGRVCSGSVDQTVRLWDVGSGESVQTLSGHTGAVYSVAWSTDGRVCSASYDQTVRVWDVLSGENVKTFSGHSSWVTSVAWSTDGRVCSGSDDNTVRVWDVGSGECVQILKGHSYKVTSVAWSTDGRVCSGSYDQTVRVWDVESGECVQTLRGHSSMVTSVAWSPDGRVHSLSDENRVLVWDSVTGQAVCHDSSYKFCRETFLPQSDTDPLGIMPEMRTSKCPTDPRRAIAQSSSDELTIHPLLLLGFHSKVKDKPLGVVAS